MKKRIDELKEFLEKAAQLAENGQTVLEVVKLYEKMKEEYDVKQMRFVTEESRFESERRRLSRWFSRHQWTLDIGSGGRNTTTLTHKIYKTKFQDLSEEHSVFKEFVRRLKSEKFNMDIQIQDLEKLIREHAQTKRDLEERERKLESEHTRKLRQLKNREEEIRKMENIPAMLAEAKELKEKARKARQELQREKRDLKRLKEDFADKEKGHE